MKDFAQTVSYVFRDDGNRFFLRFCRGKVFPDRFFLRLCGGKVFPDRFFPRLCRGKVFPERVFRGYFLFFFKFLGRSGFYRFPGVPKYFRRPCFCFQRTACRTESQRRRGASGSKPAAAAAAAVKVTIILIFVDIFILFSPSDIRQISFLFMSCTASVYHRIESKIAVIGRRQKNIE